MGCKRANKDSPTNEAGPQQIEATSSVIGDVETATRIPTAQLRSAGFETKDPPEEWKTETFQDAASQQLKRLKKVVLDGSAKHLEGLATANARCGELSPTIFQSLYEDDFINVQRAPKSAQTQQRSLLSQLTLLAKQLNDGTERYGQLKISSVDVSDSVTKTIVEAQFTGKTESSVKQYTAQWLCHWQSSSAPPQLQLIEPIEQEWTTTKQGPIFQNCTQSVIGATESFREQLTFGVDHWMARIEQRYGINSSGWQGIAIGDVNGDLLDDLYVLQPGGLPNRLYVQQPDGTLLDRSAASGVDWWDHSHAALFLDLDNDADQDLVVATALGLIFMSNDGSGKFTVETAKLCPEAMPFTLAAADSDRDGDLDIFASCYSPRGNAIGTQFLARPVPYHDANNGGRNCFFRNDGGWQFKNATCEVGLDENNRRFSLAASWADFDNDGDQDLYVANDYGRNNLYRNDNGYFRDVAAAAGVEDLSAGMSIAWGDWNRDGNLDLYVSNMWSSAGNRIAYQRQFQATSDTEVKAEFQRHARGNSLFANRGDGTFTDATVDNGVALGRWAWGSRFLDLNNNGYEDLVVANGFITQQDEQDL